MTETSPQSGQSDRPSPAERGRAADEMPDWSPSAPASRDLIDPHEADLAARAYWDAEADDYQAEHGAFLAESAYNPTVRTPTGAGFVWGPEGLSETEAGMLGPLPELAGELVLEVGCGAAQCSRWLAQHGVRAVGLDISVAQLRHAGASVPVVAGSGIALPFGDRSMSAAFASYGAVQFVADLDALMAEVARVLRPEGRWVFSVTHPIRWAFPDEPGPEGLSVAGSYFDRTPYIERESAGGPAVYAEFHRTVGDYVAALRRAGFEIDSLVEPPWPEWNDATWGGWSPLRGRHLPGTLIIGSRAAPGPTAARAPG